MPFERKFWNCDKPENFEKFRKIFLEHLNFIKEDIIQDTGEDIFFKNGIIVRIKDIIEEEKILKVHYLIVYP